MTDGIRSNIMNLLKEANKTPTDLQRFGLSQGTAYKLASTDVFDDNDGIRAGTIRKLCKFFSNELNRKVGPGDILLYEEETGNS